MIKKIKRDPKKFWWSGLTAEDMKSIYKKKSQKGKNREPWSDVYADVYRSKKSLKNPKENKTSQ